MTAVTDEQIKVAVVGGNRPPLEAITGGPADLVLIATHWIPLCWHQLPEQRPSFDGKLFLNTHNFCHFLFLVLYIFKM